MSARVAEPVIRIEPPRRRVAFPWRELWAHRELLYFLVWRDVKIRYKQTVLGAAWAVLQPFLTMVVFSIFFGRLAGIPSDGKPYPVFAFAALVPWTYFATAVTAGSNSLVGSQNLVTKVYFPRMVIPLAAALTPLVDFAIAFSILLVLAGYYGTAPGGAIFYLPCFLGLAFLTALATSLWLSALNVRYRDVRYTVPFLVQLWLFATPVAYPASLVPDGWRWVYSLNPMVGVVDGFRWALLGTSAPAVSSLASVGVTVLLLLGGIAYFRRTESFFADVI